MSAKPVKVTDQNTPWNRRNSYKRPYVIASKPKGKSYLIICEGKNTEVEYLRCIPAPNATVTVQGGYGSKTSLVNRALELKKREEYQGYKVWCVYDLDYRGEQVGQKQDFNESIELARRHDMDVAYSNDSFELWFVLHYQPVEQAFLRFDYYRILTELWNMENYEEDGKKLDFCRYIYDLLQNDPSSSEARAIERAEQIFRNNEHLPFADQNPCTTIFELIKLLQER
ncbi:MAG: RloB family protein [Bacteroidota bacterium]